MNLVNQNCIKMHYAHRLYFTDFNYVFILYQNGWFIQLEHVNLLFNILLKEKQYHHPFTQFVPFIQFQVICLVTAVLGINNVIVAIVGCWFSCINRVRKK